MKSSLLLAVLFLQLSTYAQYQVQKGRWAISHTIGGYNFTKTEWKESEEDQLNQHQTNTTNGFELTFAGPNWGGIGFNTQKTVDEIHETDSKSSGSSIWLEPQIGYFVRNNLLIGANVLLGYESEKYSSESYNEHGTGRYFTAGIGPVLTYYFGKNTKRRPFAGLESRFDFAKEKDKDYYIDALNEYDTKGSRYMIRPYAGYAWFLGKRWTVSARAEYTYVKETSNREHWYYENGVPETTTPEKDKVVATTNVIGLTFGITYIF